MTTPTPLTLEELSIDDTLADLHVINAHARRVELYHADPNIDVPEEMRVIQSLRIRAHERLCSIRRTMELRRTAPPLCMPLLKGYRHYDEMQSLVTEIDAHLRSRTP